VFAAGSMHNVLSVVTYHSNHFVSFESLSWPAYACVHPGSVALIKTAGVSNWQTSKSYVTPAWKTRVKELCVEVASGTGNVARRVMTRRVDAHLVFRIELCSILCDYDARFWRVSNTCVKNAGVTSDWDVPLFVRRCVHVIGQSHNRRGAYCTLASRMEGDLER